MMHVRKRTQHGIPWARYRPLAPKAGTSRRADLRDGLGAWLAALLAGTACMHSCLSAPSKACLWALRPHPPRRRTMGSLPAPEMYAWGSR